MLADWDTLDRTDAATFLQKIAMIITSRIGGTSGPIWGTAFLRASMVARSADVMDAATVVAMLDSAVEGIKARGGASVGDKTLLDAIVPMRDTIAERVRGRSDLAGGRRRGCRPPPEPARRPPARMQAMRGRAAYTGERSIGSPDAGAIAVAVIAEAIARRWAEGPAAS